MHETNVRVLEILCLVPNPLIVIICMVWCWQWWRWQWQWVVLVLYCTVLYCAVIFIYLFIYLFIYGPSNSFQWETRGYFWPKIVQTTQGSGLLWSTLLRDHCMLFSCQKGMDYSWHSEPFKKKFSLVHKNVPWHFPPIFILFWICSHFTLPNLMLHKLSSQYSFVR
jgi:hypothetical protein